MSIHRISGLTLSVFLSVRVFAQEAESGITMPVTITGEGLYTHRLQSSDPSASPITGAFHAALYPGFKFGPHWFFYSSIHLSSTPFYYYDSYESDHELETQVLQMFLGYTQNFGNTSVMVKAGKLTSAFGAFPPHYDDADNPLLDQPIPYSAYLTLRPDQLPCGVNDLVRQQPYSSANYSCGGSWGAGEGLTPVTLYGLPGVEVDLSTHKVDARFQLTNSSPVNPQSLLSSSQHAQWTAGAGIPSACVNSTIRGCCQSVMKPGWVSVCTAPDRSPSGRRRGDPLVGDVEPGAHPRQRRDRRDQPVLRAAVHPHLASPVIRPATR